MEIGLKEAAFKSLRELAAEKEASEQQVLEELREQGFRRLSEPGSDSLSFEWRPSDLEKNRLQGAIGEQASKLLRGRIKRFLRKRMNGSWEILEKPVFVNENRFTPTGYREDGVNFNGRKIVHFGEEGLREKVRQRYLHLEEGLFERFREYRFPHIDETLFGVKKKGETRRVGFTFEDRSKEIGNRKNRETVEIEQVEDFKLLYVEVKTSNREASKLLTENQRKAREKVRETPYAEFFTASIDLSWEESRLPETLNFRLEKG